MTVHDDPETVALWDDFHTVVNMTSRELGDWLRVRSSGPDGEELPDQAGTERGRQVLAVLGKRRCDLTADDPRLMRRVVTEVREERRGDLEPTAGEAHWRHRLTSIGHDPLEPVRDVGARAR
ncbi:MAG: DUF3140 domain-containing protein [Actinomycetota bacterium]